MKIHIITPAQTFEEEGQGIIFNGNKGETSVLDNHADYLDIIKENKLKIFDSSNKITKIYDVKEGMLRFYHDDNLCIISTVAATTAN